MANTPYIDLVKPAGTDKALISVLNANSDKIDSAVGGVQDALAIVCNGNTHGAITSGQYVYVRAHDTLQEGLYTANSNIAANATLSSSNLTANSSGGLNALNEQIGTLSSKITKTGKIYRVMIGASEVVSGSYFTLLSNYLEDGFVTVSNNEIHFSESANVLVTVDLIGKTTDAGTRSWIFLEGGNYNIESIGYGVYIKHSINAVFAVGTSTALKLKNLDDNSFNPGGGGTSGTMICIIRLKG